MRVRVERCGHLHKPMRHDPGYANESHVPLCRPHCDERRGDVRGAVRRIRGTDPAWHTSFGHERNDGGEAAKYAFYGLLAAFLTQGVMQPYPQSPRAPTLLQTAFHGSPAAGQSATWMTTATGKEKRENDTT